jgi:hypothetical protein
VALLEPGVKPEGTSRLVDKCEAATGWKFGHAPILPVDD